MLEKIDNKILAQKIINLLYLSGQELSHKDLLRLLQIEKIENEIFSQVKENVRSVLCEAGLVFVENNNHYAIVTHSDHGELLESFSEHIMSGELSPAQLQVLTIVAYLNSVSLAEISFVRGVQSMQTVRSLTTRGLLEKNKNTQEKDEYVLSLDALRHLGISNIKDLPDFEKINNNLKEKINMALNG
jgi:segregation and condensation protein B